MCRACVAETPRPPTSLTVAESTTSAVEGHGRAFGTWKAKAFSPLASSVSVLRISSPAAKVFPPSAKR